MPLLGAGQGQGCGGVHKKRCEGISLVHLDLTRSWSGESKKWEVVTKASLSHWCIWLPGQGAYSLFVGMLRQPENMKF